ncbi:serine/threonine-protein kinase cbk1 [Verticillium dahliae VdLs.17]|uniref:non-specific serine/threonine protein kinase n=1 Tax=Verticillium dahliae (strain VdLs.17 / ATCC MYA-4575 / FGSC 10137) TaxID=498257 RepID=G2WYT4_VERDV|nr:serine/threonine-protein kinase cbk1 [Verticillium dahliae VdLs.17]EGY21736.1 serine/threonine-protein kinase cbk1 [Verticillium dahliae VdLs.17]KAH6703565.1 serine/threonine-protein kinase cbk1 [Verticillium dahliae]
MNPGVEVPVLFYPQDVKVRAMEKAATAKAHFETYYNDLLQDGPSPRSARLDGMRSVLDSSPMVLPEDRKELETAFFQQETHHLRQSRVLKWESLRAANRLVDNGQGPCVKNYSTLKNLGKGSFGVVRLVREKGDGDLQSGQRRQKNVYAMKVIRKTDMIRSSQEGHLRAERDFLIASETSEWIVQLISSFQDATNLYLVMEYMPGGDFLGLLIRENILEEHVARHYVAEMVVCVEEAHRLGFIHRDVKPDNFLIDAHGHLKISDFGLAFDGRWQHDTAYYLWQRDDLMRNLGIAVEGDATDQKEDTKTSKAHKRHQDRIPLVGSLLDWRATRNRTYAKSVVGTSHIGIILYECLYGCTPFLAEGGRHDTKKKILAHDASTFEFPRDIPGVSYECQHLILQLLQNQECRLSSPKYRSQDPLAPQHYVFAEDDAIDIKNHPWFQYLDWNHLHRMTPGFVPHLHASDDTRYFDEDEPVSDWSETVESEEPVISPHKMKRLLRREGFCSRSIGSFMGYIATPFDTTRLRQIDQRIEGKAHFSEEDKHVLKYLVRKFGCKERKGARDILLRDPTTRRDVMNVRKQKAFVDYTWKRAPAPPCLPVAAVDDDGVCYHEEMTETYQQERHAYEAYAAQGTYWELDGQYEIGGGPYAMVNTMYWQGQQQYEQRLDRPYFWDGQYR